MSRDELIRLMCVEYEGPVTGYASDKMMARVLDAIEPLIRAAALREAAASLPVRDAHFAAWLNELAMRAESGK